MTANPSRHNNLGTCTSGTCPLSRFAKPILALAASAALLPLLAAIFAPPLSAQPFDQNLFSEMRWRSIGPYRAGRTRAVAGVPSEPNVFYMGVCNGGVWKTTDYGRTWRPIFDDQPTGSIGAIAVSPSNPDIVYVASGEGLQRPDLSVGDGIYKSTDAGRTWTHLGLRDGQQIPQIIVDPRNPDRVFAAVLGHPYGPNEERGIYRSLDGGTTFERVLYVDENTGGSELAFDPSNPAIVYAGLWESRQGPWENAAWSGPHGGLFKSIDGGTNWRKLEPNAPSGAGSSMPTAPTASSAAADAVVQINLGLAPSAPRRIYAAVAFARGTALFRSDDAGATWARLPDTRPAGRIGGGDLPRIAVHPSDPDTVFVVSTVSWKSTDGGRTFRAFKGAPGGDDYQNLWINPSNGNIILYASDQGAVITVNGGETWSSWYNQPTAQLYHAAADNAFPYRVYSGQQESGSAGVSSRGDDGRITFRDWRTVGVDEYGYAAPDPLDPDIVYGGRGVTRWDRRTGQVQTVGPRVSRAPDWRTVRTQPVLFSPVDPRTLYFAANTLWKTRNGGQSWTQISPDLTRETWDVPAGVGKYKSEPSAQPSRRGVIYTVAPSYVDANRIWVGTDDGLIHVTANGGHSWINVTPPQLTPWAKVSVMDAGRFDALTAYAAVNTLRLDDMRPHIYRTHDGGKTWTEIVNGLPDGAPTNAVREDPVRRGLLFAATERQVYVSFDDGDHWQTLRLNMAPSSVRDIVVKDDDLVAATHGRGFWILDNITPFRQLDEKTAAAEATLFRPQIATRVRWNMNTDTPLPPDEPGGENPPDGAVIDYALKSDASGPVTIEIVDGTGRVIRRYTSADKGEYPTPESAPVPLYWYRKPLTLKTAAGMHRFLWDMRYQPLVGGGRRGGLPIAATPWNTVPTPNSIWAPPGLYTIKLTVDGQTLKQPLTLRMDPRVKTPASGLAQQFELSRAMYEGVLESQAALQKMRVLRGHIKKAQEAVAKAQSPAEVTEVLAAFDKKAAALEGGAGGAGGPGGMGGQMGPGGPGAAGAPDTLSGISGSLNSLMNMLQEADAAPTSQLVAAVTERRQALSALLGKWESFRTLELAALNTVLKAANLPEITLER
ncbi:MAG: glycoside hydrolase [Acidobacteria bacterium]|nr:glycoside hydrolase [Acidobacteriota bacterium]